MNKGRFFIITLAFVFISGFVVAPSAYASNNNFYPNWHMPSYHFSFNNFWHNDNNKHDKDDLDKGKHNGNDDGKKNDCIKHPENPNCTVSVPEFGFVPGVVAALTSAGSFLVLKRRKN